MDKGSVKGCGPIEVLDEVGSTNAVLMERALAGAPHGTAIRARVQTAGRGRRTHNWASPEGGLYLSILVKPTVPDCALPGLPVAFGLGVVRALEGLGCRGIALKWPNDVICARGKLGGILVELKRSSGEALAVCGLGLNLRSVPFEPSDATALPGAGVADCLPADAPMPTLDGLAAAVRASALQAIDAWTAAVDAAGEGAAPLTGIEDAYNALMAYRGERVHAGAPDGSVSADGVLAGVDPWGRALVELADGTVQAFNAAIVSIRPAC